MQWGQATWGEWGVLKSLLPHNALSVVSITDAVRQLRDINRCARSPTERAIAREALCPLPQLKIEDTLGENALPPGNDVGVCVLQAYFIATTCAPVAWLDYRAHRFGARDRQTVWAPPSWAVRWDPIFQAAIADMYNGFYRQNDTQFVAGLSQLKLEGARDLFRAHFGAQQQRIKFKKKDFLVSFGNIFEYCAVNKIRLHPNFIPLGISLATLYDCLETLGDAYNVAAAFQTTPLTR